MEVLWTLRRRVCTRCVLRGPEEFYWNCDANAPQMIMLRTHANGKCLKNEAYADRKQRMPNSANFNTELDLL